MAKLKVKRKSEWINRSRNIGIYLDGVKIGKVSNGETTEFEIPGGSHELKAKMDWCGSNKISFVVSGDQVHTIILSAFKFANILLAIELLIVVIHIFLKYSYGISYFIWFAIPFFFCNVYYVTLGRNSYLLIREDDLSLSF